MTLRDSIKYYVQFVNQLAQNYDDGYEFLERLSESANELFGGGNASATKIDQYLDEMEQERYAITSSGEKELLYLLEDTFSEYVDSPYYDQVSLSEVDDSEYGDLEDSSEWRDYLSNRYSPKSPDYSESNRVSAKSSDFEDYDDYYERIANYKLKDGYSPKYKKNSYYNYGFKQAEQRDYYVIGYGSLVNARSRSRTVSVLDEAYVKVDGFSRIFNVGAGGGTVLNVKKNPNSWINAVLMKIDWRDMDDLYLREMQYEEVNVPKENISFPYGGEKMEMEYEPIIFVSSSEVAQEPKPDYLKACIYGAYQIGAKFLRDFIKTTRIHDGTPLGRYMVKKFGQKVFKQFKTADSKY